MRLAYADPPYPGMAHLYPENTEVDHVELVDRLSGYDGWALSTDERNLRFVLALCPADTRVLAWCKSDAPPNRPNPWASWEPVLCRPARTAGATVRSFYVGPAPPRGFCVTGPTLVGAKSDGFCEWVLRCLGAETDDTLDDLFPGTGVMGRTWDRWSGQLPLFTSSADSFGGRFNKLRRHHEQLPGMPEPIVHKERTTTNDRKSGFPDPTPDAREAAAERSAAVEARRVANLLADAEIAAAVPQVCSEAVDDGENPAYGPGNPDWERDRAKDDAWA